MNPAIPLGGLVGESKAQILEEIGDRDEVLRWTLVAPGDLEDRRRTVEGFADSLETRWPLVLKPDRGERGLGVHVARTPAERDAALRTVEIPVLAQEFATGLEFGVFWYRSRDAGNGVVFSVSRKAPIVVEGDGTRTLDELLCANDRVLPLLDRIRQRQLSRLEEIPGPGARVRVTELGTHSLGATFLDSMHLRSEKLARALDSLMAGARLDFGRFDFLVPSEHDLVEGQNLKMIEFNGLSGEAAHLYDPGNTWAEGRSILLEQWTWALRVGHRNREAGVRPATWRQVWRALRSHLGDRGRRGG